MNQDDKSKFGTWIFIKIVKLLFYLWPIVVYDILATYVSITRPIFQFIPIELTSILVELGLVTGYSSPFNINWIQMGLFALICYGPFANAVNKRFGDILPSFKRVLKFIKAWVNFGGKSGKRDKKIKISEKLDRQFVNKLQNEKPDYVLTGFYEKGPVYTSDKARTHHTQVVGSSGSGKSESVLKNWCYQDIMRGKGLVFIDPKGDINLAAETGTLASDMGRKVYYLSLMHECKYTMTYNPLLVGDASQCANKIFNSFDWESDYYKMRAFDFFQMLLSILKRSRGQVLLSEMIPFLREPKECAKEDFLKTVTDPDDRAELSLLSRTKKDDLTGLYSKLSLLCRNDTVSKVFMGNDINIREIVDQGGILLAQLPTAANTIEAKAIARMVIQDLNLVSAYRQQTQGDKVFFSVFIDEFNSFLFDGFLDFLEKARSANFGLVLAHQSLANLERLGRHYMKQVFENTSIKAVMKHNDPDSARYISQSIGEYYHQAETHTSSELNDVLGFDQKEGRAVSVREEKRFIVEPTVITSLAQGEGLYISEGVRKVKFRYWGPYYNKNMYKYDFNKFKQGEKDADNTKTSGTARAGSGEGESLAHGPDRESQGPEENGPQSEDSKGETPGQDSGDSQRPEF